MVNPLPFLQPMILLGVNIDHCATVRQARYRGYDLTIPGPAEPDPVALAVLSERAGADGITIHLREDRRHIQEIDVWRLKEVAKTRINLEMACTPAMMGKTMPQMPTAMSRGMPMQTKQSRALAMA